MPEVNALTKQVTNRERQVRYGGVFLLTLGILFWSLGVSVSYAA